MGAWCLGLWLKRPRSIISPGPMPTATMTSPDSALTLSLALPIPVMIGTSMCLLISSGESPGKTPMVSPPEAYEQKVMGWSGCTTKVRQVLGQDRQWLEMSDAQLAREGPNGTSPLPLARQHPSLPYCAHRSGGRSLRWEERDQGKICR